MDENIQTVLSVMGANGGMMLYKDLYNHPDILPFRKNLHNIKAQMRNRRLIVVNGVTRDENGVMQSSWSLPAGGE